MGKNKKYNRNTLKVNKGVEQPSAVNPKMNEHLGKFKKKKINVSDYFAGILSGDRSMLSRAITLIESTLPEDRESSKHLVRHCLPYSGKSVRIGITGVPGVGKSTFIEALGLDYIREGKKVAVLAIDPSSRRSKGSILGDKTRMEHLSTLTNAFIRPSANAGTLGGVARETHESIILCEAAGFDTIFVETVGVGQSETTVAHMVDFFLLLMLAGGGDELQGIKRGIMEMADLIVINKADGDNINKTQLAKREYENALHIFPSLKNGWHPKVLTASTVEHTGLDKIKKEIDSFLHLTKSNGYFEKTRQRQDILLFEENIRNALVDRFFQNNKMKQMFESYRKKIALKQVSSYEAANELLEFYFNKIT